MEVKFISNSLEPQAHDKQIVEQIKSSDEVWMSVAFLKLGGLALIYNALQDCINANKKVHIVAGLYFGITDPVALTKLLEMLKGNSLYLARDGAKERNFHPKLYIFRSGKNYTIISGSANITNGGLTKNIECSLQVTAHEDESVCKDALKFIDDLINNNCDLATVPLIAQYEKEWLKQKENPKNSKWNKGFDDEEVADEPGKERKYYKLTLGRKNDIVEDCLNRGYIGVGYRIKESIKGDLEKSKIEFENKYKAIIREAYKEINNGVEIYPTDNVVTRRCDMFWKLFKNVKIGDIFICPDGNDFLVGEIIPKEENHSDKNLYFFAEPPPDLLYYYVSNEDYPHRMSIRWNGKILKSSMPENFKSSIKANTFYELTPEYIIMIETLIKSESFIKFSN